MILSKIGRMNTKDGSLAMTDQRTIPQNNSLHLFCKMVAEELNDAGYTVNMVMKENWDVSWTAGLVKELIWKGFLKAKYNKDSTTEMTTKEVDAVYNDININLAEKFGISLEFPDRFYRSKK